MLLVMREGGMEPGVGARLPDTELEQEAEDRPEARLS